MSTTKTINVSKEACDARNALKLAIRWCFETIGNIAEHEMARALKDDAHDHLIAVCGHDGSWTMDHELAFREDIRKAVRLSGRY